MQGLKSRVMRILHFGNSMLAPVVWCALSAPRDSLANAAILTNYHHRLRSNTHVRLERLANTDIQNHHNPILYPQFPAYLIRRM